MRALLLSAMLVSTALVALAPTTEARAFCSDAVDDWCPSVLCTYDAKNRVWTCLDDSPIDCVRECSRTVDMHALLP